MYALVGNWGFVPGMSKGLSIFKYNPETANLDFIETILEDVYVGQHCTDPEKNIIYVVNEIGSRRGEIGGGGYVMALKIDPETGKVTVLNEKESLAPEPSYICLDKSKKYVLVVHHVDSGHVTKILQDENGKYIAKQLFDDAALVLFKLNEDGSLSNACDVSITEGIGLCEPHAIAHQHSVVCDPTGELYLVCDKGTDKIYSYHVDRVNDKLVFLGDTVVEIGSSPRYGAFHPTLPLFYANNEHKTVVYSFRYGVQSGLLKQLDTTQLLLDEKEAEGLKKVEAGDIIVHPNGKFMFVSIRGIEYLAMLTIDDNGKLTLKQNIHCGGVNPRGMCLSPDGRFLFAANMLSGTITTFAIADDGLLSAVNGEVKGVSPANMSIFVGKP